MLTLKNIGSIVEVKYCGKVEKGIVDMVNGNRIHLSLRGGQLGVTENVSNVSIVELNKISVSELAIIEALLAKIETVTELVETSFEEGDDDYYEAMEETVEPLEEELDSVIEAIIV